MLFHISLNTYYKNCNIVNLVFMLKYIKTCAFPLMSSKCIYEDGNGVNTNFHLP